MTSALTAVEAMAYELLAAGVDLAKVFQDVPENYQDDVVIVGDLSADPFTDASDDPDRRVSLTINAVTIGDERSPCSALQEQVETVLGKARAVRDGWELIFRSLGSDASLTPDGSGYAGTTTFEIIAFSQG